MRRAIILGLIGWPVAESHDGSAALYRNGKIVEAAEQERFSRRKHARGEAPVDAALFCLRHAGITLRDVDYVTYGWCEEETSPRSEILSPWLVRSFYVSFTL